MHTDKDRNLTDATSDTAEEGKDSTLEWLLDMDMSEPQESLFTVDAGEYTQQGLSQYEAEVAARPLTRGKHGADDFASYVGEEIVISSETESSDIYNTAPDLHEHRNGNGSAHVVETMAIDYSRHAAVDNQQTGRCLEEGMDILGLSSDDDMGEKYLVLKKVKHTRVEPPKPLADSPLMPELPREEPLMLSQAPALRLVSAPGERAVANENAVPGSVADAVAAENLNEYIHQVKAPTSEQEFDSYLLNGEQLPETAFSPEQFLVEHGPGVVPVDSSPQQAVDFHEDFLAMPGFGESLVEGIELDAEPSSEWLGAVQPIASESVNEELATAPPMLEGKVDAVTAEAPMGELFAADSPDIDLEAEFSRAQHHSTGADIDEVFADLGFTGDAVGSDADSGDIDSLDLSADFDLVTDEEVIQGFAEEAEQLQVFEEDIFAGDFLGSMESAEETPAEDIEALFDSLGKDVPDHGEICGLDVDEFSIASGAGVEQTAVAPTAGLESQNERIHASVEPVHSPAASQDNAWCVPQGIAFSYASKSSGEIFSDFLDAFIEEGSSELEKLEDAIGLWEKDIDSEAPYVTVTRVLHTIKGIAKGVGLQFYGTLIHNFETLLESLPRPQGAAPTDYFRIVNVWLDAAVRGLDFVQANRTDIVSEFPLQTGRLDTLAEAAVTAQVDAPAEAAVVTPTTGQQVRSQRVAKQLADDGAKALAAQQTVRITSEKLDHMLNLANQAQQLGVRTAQSAGRGKRTTAEMQTRLASVRAHIAGIADRALRTVTARGVQGSTEMDALEMDQYTELQEAANILREGVEDLADLVDFASRQNAQVEALLKQQGGVIASIGSSIRAARVVPVSRLIPGLRRLVRTVSNDLGKDVSLQVLNELGTLDRDDFGRCQTILDHMVRNALDHGIECSDQRAAAGKAATGRVSIDIRKAGADAIITLADDGRGIDPEAMRESALKKGLDIEVDALSDADAQRLIFHKGFSTAAAVSQISGRGVGMDIVLSEIQQMGGDIQIESVVGRGTSFHIRIPSSVTVNGALLVTAAEQSYAIPLGGLIAVEQVPVDEFLKAVEAGTTLSLAGLECEPAYLGTLCQGQRLPEKKVWGASIPVIIAGPAARKMAIAVDDVEEALELVIRSLGVQFSTVPGVAGAATTADGEAIVALDLNLLVASAGDGQNSQVSVGSEREESLLALVVDDSRTQRMVATSQLETVGVETVTAENGAVAIDLLNCAERLPDIILLDVEMPVKDGIQTLREIRKSVRYSHIPVIMITSRTGLKHRALAQAAGCNGYMGKPFNFRMLIGQINELTGHRLQLT